MRKTILTLDEINLFLKSEEPKNKSLYGNLYEVLSELSPSKALSDEQAKLFDNIAISALTYNKKTLLDTVIQEWYAERVTAEDPNKKIKCGLCNTPNKYLYYIRNRLNNNVLNVGSSCITKFPNIDGYIEQRQQLAHILKNQKKVSRKNEFHRYYPHVEDIILRCEEFENELQIAIPYNLHENLKNTIIRIRKIYTMYIESGKTPFKTTLNPFDLFQINLNHFSKIQKEINCYIEDNINNPYICKKREVIWLKKNEKLSTLKSIEENNGLYTKSTIGLVYSYEFIHENFFNIMQHKSTNLFKIHDIKKESKYIYTTLHKTGYDYPVSGNITFQDFMKKIGSNCLFDNEYYFTDDDILPIINIDISLRNIQSILNYIFNMMEELNFVFLFDYNANKLILYRKNDKAIKYFEPRKFINAYIKNILKDDKVIYNLLYFITKKSNTKWTTYEEQEKYDITDKIGKMYKEQYLSIPVISSNEIQSNLNVENNRNSNIRIWTAE